MVKGQKGCGKSEISAGQDFDCDCRSTYSAYLQYVTPPCELAEVPTVLENDDAIIRTCNSSFYLNSLYNTSMFIMEPFNDPIRPTKGYDYALL